MFVGSEGTLGVITGARLRLHPTPAASGGGRGCSARSTSASRPCAGRCSGARTPAVLRLYDAAEANRSYHTGDKALLLALDEGDGTLVDATFEVLAEECAAAGGHRGGDEHVDHWLAHRNEVAALEALTSKGYMVDTMEVAGPWADLPAIYRATLDALLAVEGTVAASAHQSHSYPSGACLYFTFAGQVDDERRDAYYRALWDAGQRAALVHGGALSHHHGVGLNRGRYLAEALGPAFGVLAATKAALDPHGILNPGKLGLAVAVGGPRRVVTAARPDRPDVPHRRAAVGQTRRP